MRGFFEELIIKLNAQNSVMATNTKEEYAEVASTTTGGIMQDRQKMLTYGVIGILLAVGLYFAYKVLWVGSRQTDAVEQMQFAEQMFEQDSFNLALTNPGGGNKGFLAIIDEYSGTPTSNLCHMYAGICYLNMGQFDKAIEYLEDYSAGGDVLGISKWCALGDAYGEKNDLDKALSCYKKAVDAGNNEAQTPICLKKLAMLSEKKGDKAAAIEAYTRLKREFATTQDGRDADKYLARLGAVK